MRSSCTGRCDVPGTGTSTPPLLRPLAFLVVPVDDRIPFTQAELTVGPDTGWHVTWATADRFAAGIGRVTVEAAPTPDGPWVVAGEGGPSGTVPITSDTGPRPYVRLMPEAGAPLTITTRSVGLASAPNLRDAGGYRTDTGQWVRMGVVYRGGSLTFPDDELATVDALGWRTSYDLRTPGENETKPDMLPPGAVRIACNVSGSPTIQIPELTTVEAVEDLMTRAPIAYLTMEPAIRAYSTMLAGLADRDGAAIFHCTAGKDRTGWGSALLLGLLGVPDETVIADYLLSNEYYLGSPAMQAHFASLPAQDVPLHTALIGVQPAYLQSGLDAVRERFGSMTGYATEALRLTADQIARLRAKLLVGAPYES